MHGLALVAGGPAVTRLLRGTCQRCGHQVATRFARRTDIRLAVPHGPTGKRCRGSLLPPREENVRG